MAYQWISPRDRPRPRPGRRGSTVVLCLAQAGHRPAPFARWPDDVDGVELWTLSFPGDREPSWWTRHATIVAQATHLAAELSDPPADRFALFGEGSSALIAYEAAANLTRSGGPAPSRLILSGCSAPSRARRRGPRPDTEAIEEQALTALLRYGGNPLPSLLDATVHAMTVESTAVLAYRPPAAPWFATPIDAVSWSRDPEADPASMTDWASFGPTELFTLEGSRHTYTRAPSELLKMLTRA
jgi:surfactin synthase thioesterase subunit